MRKGRTVGVKAAVSMIRCTHAAALSDYIPVLNGKHMKSVSRAGFCFPSQRLETLQEKKKKKKAFSLRSVADCRITGDR